MGIEECQHTFEILVDAFLHAQDGVIQPHLITISKIKDMMRRESLPDGLDFPSFPSLQLSRLSTSDYLLSKFLSCKYSSHSLNTFYPYQLYKFLLFPHGTVRKVLCILK